MKDPFSQKRQSRLADRLLEIDGAIDDGLFSSFNWLREVAVSFSTFMRKFRVHGWKRIPVEVMNEGLTWGAVGAVFMFMLAQTAFESTHADWRKQDDYSVTFVDLKGDVIGRRGVLQNKPIDLSETQDHTIKATLATEDRRFYSHFGIDFIGILRALGTNVKANGVVEGGSSITQQVAKNVFLNNERTLTRKIKEAFLALWLEYNLTKNEILELYFNRAYLGGGAFGIPAASEFYFDKHYSELNLAESAMLAGLFKAPTNYAPHINLANARARANEVLTNMVQGGFLTEGQTLAARQNPASAVNRKVDNRPDHYMDWAYDEVVKLGIKSDRVLTVVSSIDTRLQDHAQRTINQYLFDEGVAYNIREGATVVMTPEGFVRAMVGGKDYGQSQFNRAVDALRSPGSTFKAYVYATAMENGYTPKSIVRDAPIYFKNWTPKNYTRSYSGPVSLTTALVKSINTVPVRLAHAPGIGRPKVIEMTRAMGVTSELRNTPSLPIGSSEVSVLELTAGYSVFANGGFKAKPKAFFRVMNSKGEVLVDLEKEAKRERVLSNHAVASMNEILSQVPEWGTGRRAKLEDRKTAGKTGTTQAYRDAWFVGYTGNYVGAVWYGNDNYQPTNRLTGGRLPAMTWKTILEYAHSGVEVKPIPFLDADGKADLSIAEIAAEQENQAQEALTNANTLSPESSEVLTGIGSLFKTRTGPFDTALVDLPSADGSLEETIQVGVENTQ